MAKANKKQVLGRGLSALLKDPDNDISTFEDKNAQKIVNSVVELELSAIELNPFQPRTQFNEEALHQLAASIKELGIIQPLTVRKVAFNKYQLVSGERRLRASKIAGIDVVPAFVRIANDQEALEMALVENIQRQDLDPIEIALSYQRLIDEIKLTQEQMSSRVGKKRSTIANYLRLLKLDPIIQTGMRDGFISMGHGRAIINISNHKDQLEIYEQILSKKLSVRATELIVKNYHNPKVLKKESKLNSDLKNKIKNLSADIGANITVKLNANQSGKINIPFTNEGDLIRLIKLIKGDH
jgi:ParB family chromosome partitioning protein